MAGNSFYVKNTELLVEISKYRETCRYSDSGEYIKGSGKASETLGKMIMKIANGLAQKANYAGYTWLDDMKAEAVYTVIKYLKNFDPEKSQNPFSYITQICQNAFISYIAKQKKHSHIKNALFEYRENLLEEEDIYKTPAVDYNNYS